MKVAALFFILVAGVLLLSSSCVGASDVLELNPTLFDDTIKDNEFVLVEFFAPWCGHCKALAPEYETAATELVGKEPAIKLAKVDCTAHSGLCSRFGVQGYPTLKFFRSGEPIDYAGPRDAAGIVSWVTTKAGPVLSVLTTEEQLATFKTQKANGVYLLGHFAADSEGLKTFTAATSNPGTDSWSFGNVAFGTATDAVTLHRTHNPDDATFEKTGFTADELVEWASEHAFPYVGEVTTQYARISQRGLPMVLVFIDSTDKAALEEALAWLEPIAKSHYSQFSFAYVGKSYHARLPGLGGSGNVLPTLVVLGQTGSKYPFDESQPFNSDNVAKHLAAVTDGSAKPFFKSEAVPETNDEPVKVVVGHTYKSIVHDATKDVFIEFYAPWCGHCKSLAPIWTELGERYKDSKTVVIAKVDATANDVPVQIQGFPTVLLFPADNKDEPITYEGDRDLESFVAFLKEHTGAEPAAKSDTEATDAKADKAKDEL